MDPQLLLVQSIRGADIDRQVGKNRGMVTVDVGVLQTIGVIVSMLVGVGTMAGLVLSGNRRLETRIDVLDAKFDKKFDVLDAKIVALDVKFDKRFEVLDAKIVALDAKFDKKFDASDVKLDKKSSLLDDRLRRLEIEVARHGGILERLAASVEGSYRPYSPLLAAR